MLPTPWILLSWIRTYKWLFLLFGCHCVPGGRFALANRLSQRTRFLDESHYQSNGIEKQQQQHFSPASGALSPSFGVTDYLPSNAVAHHHHHHNSGGSYRSIDKRFGLESGSSSAGAGSSQPDLREPSGPISDPYDNRVVHSAAAPSSHSFVLLKQALKSSFDSSSSSSSSSASSSLAPGTCMAPDSRTGMCYDATECADRGGIPMGRCGSSAASVCCLFESSCGDAVSERHVYFRSPHYPLPSEAPQICRLKVNKPHGDNICQLKLNFVEFDIAKPVEGNCSQDVFSVSGQNENSIIPRICGYNSGQHFYIAVDESGLVNLQLVLRGVYSRKFDIHVEQIECGSKDLAPPHCLQYFDSTQGKIKSFNYDARNGEGRGEMDAPANNGAVFEGYPNNIDYLICIRKETGFCSISYEYMSDSSGSVMPFSVGSDSNVHSGVSGRRSGSQSRISSEQMPFSSIGSNDCEDDYLIIGGLRVCSRALASIGGNDEDHVTLGPSSTSTSATSTSTANSSPETVEIFPSTESRTNDTHGDRTNGELLETMDENAAVPSGDLAPGGGDTQSIQQDQEALRRPHRRANYHYYFSDRMGPSRTRGMVSAKRNVAPASNIMATDWTPGPFQMRFVANGVNNARGFYLAYRQNPCRI